MLYIHTYVYTYMHTYTHNMCMYIYIHNYMKAPTGPEALFRGLVYRWENLCVQIKRKHV